MKAKGKRQLINVFLVLLFLFMFVATARCSMAISQDDIGICRDYESMVKYETSEINKRIDQVQVDVTKSLVATSQKLETDVSAVVEKNIRVLLAYLFVGILAVVGTSVSIVNIIRIKKERKLLEGIASKIDSILVNRKD